MKILFFEVYVQNEPYGGMLQCVYVELLFIKFGAFQIILKIFPLSTISVSCKRIFSFYIYLKEIGLYLTNNGT